MTQDLNKLKVVELRELAKKRGLSGFSKLKKAELIDLLTSNGASGGGNELDELLNALPDGDTEIKRSHVLGCLFGIVPIMFIFAMCVGTPEAIPEGNRVVDRCSNSPEAQSRHEEKKIRGECQKKNLKRQYKFAGVVDDITHEKTIWLELNEVSGWDTIEVNFNQPIDERLSKGDEIVVRGQIYDWGLLSLAATLIQADLLALNGEKLARELKPKPPVGESAKSRTMKAPLKLESMEKLSNDVGMDFVKLRSGTFNRGCNDGDEHCEEFERPKHSVTLSQAFWMQTKEVTQSQWRKVMGSNPSKFSTCGGDCPVEQVSWLDAIEFANRLSELDGLTSVYGGEREKVSWDLEANGYRLPTEAEWEYAAYAGRRTVFAGGDSIGGVGWIRENSDSKTHPVGSKAHNRWGLYDMSGNVAEWCWDYSGVYPAGTVVDPKGIDKGIERIYRGGSYDVRNKKWAMVHKRDQASALYQYGPIGLRLVRQIP